MRLALKQLMVNLLGTTFLFGAGSVSASILGPEPQGTVFNFVQDNVLVRHMQDPTKNFDGTLAQAIAAGIVVYTGPATGTATSFNSSGVLVPNISGTPRIQYDPVTLECLGYLPEPQRTNNFNYSSVLSTGWSAVNASRAASTEVTPDGGTNATLLTATATSFARVAKSGRSITSGATATRSVTVKAGTTPFIHGTIEQTGQTLRFYARLDTLVGTATTTAGTIAGTVKIVPRGNGWHRISVTFTVAATLVYDFFVGPSNAFMTTAATVGNSIHLCDAQDEDGSYATSEIPTAGSTVTRNADVMKAALSALPYQASEYSVIARAKASPDAISIQHNLFSVFKDGDDSATLRNGTAGAAGLQMVSETGNVGQVAILPTGVVGADLRAACAFKLNDAELVTDGVSRGTDTTCSMPPALTDFYIGTTGPGGIEQQWGAPIASVSLIPRRLTGAEMITRTAA